MYKNRYRLSKFITAEMQIVSDLLWLVSFTKSLLDGQEAAVCPFQVDISSPAVACTRYRALSHGVEYVTGYGLEWRSCSSPPRYSAM